MRKPFASIVILTCDSYLKKYGCIEHTLLSINNQFNRNFEIIVVDNGKNENDSKLLAEFIKKLSLKINLVKCDLHIAEARNYGAKYAAAELLIFIDEDTLVIDRNAIDKIMRYSAYFRYGYGAERKWTKPELYEHQANKIKNDMIVKDYTFLIDNIGDPDSSIREKDASKYLVRSFIGNFGFIYTSNFHEVGGFPEIFKGYGLEDDAFSFLCFIKFGYPAILDDILVAHVTHDIKPVNYEQYQINLNLYKNYLQKRGYNSFHIGDLLYKTVDKNRPVLE